MIENPERTWAWLSPEWFYISTFQNLNWQYPNLLYIMALIPLIFLVRWLISISKKRKLTIALPKKKLATRKETLLRFVPDVIMVLLISMVVLALARPQRTNEQVDQWTEGIDIMLVLDVSESMLIEDFSPNRLEAAKVVASDFINGRTDDRIGMVVFAGDAYSLSPLTTDYGLLKSYIPDIEPSMIENRGTAIGSAIAVATNRFREIDSQTKVMILLSDGDNTAGNIDPITAARLAYGYDIKIYTVAIGKEGRVPFGKDFFGRTRYVENTMDETTLREIASLTGGEFYRADSNEDLQQIFDRIDEYEKVEIKESHYKNVTDYYHIYLSWACLFLLLWLLMKSTYLNNILQD